VASAQIHVKHLPNKRTSARLDRRTTNRHPDVGRGLCGTRRPLLPSFGASWRQL